MMTDNNAEFNVQWFPGHMQKARRLIEENLKAVDAVAEVRDARVPLSCANPLLAEIIGKKKQIIILNKSDLADPGETKKWLKYFADRGIPAAAADSAKGANIKKIIAIMENIADGKRIKTARAMAVGIPNVGKSSLINRLAGQAKTEVENRPGVTRAKQWIKIGKNFELLDMPGILYPKIDDDFVGQKLAFVGSIRDEIFDRVKLSMLLMNILREKEICVEAIKRRYKTEKLPTDNAELLMLIGKKRGFLLKGGDIDEEKAAVNFLKEFRAGLLGRVTLDECPENTEQVS